MPAALLLVSKALAPMLQLMPHYTTPRKAARVTVRILTGASPQTGVHFDENGAPVARSKQVHDPALQDRLVRETRALLATADAA